MIYRMQPADVKKACEEWVKKYRTVRLTECIAGVTLVNGTDEIETDNEEFFADVLIAEQHDNS